MKTLKRILAIAILLIVIVGVSYCVYTAQQIQSEAVYEATKDVIY